MEKKNTATCILMIPILTALIGFGLMLKKGASAPQGQDHRDYTEIYIINGDHEETGWFKGPSKSELLKAITEYPQHLFITPSLWKSFCHHRAEQIKHLDNAAITEPYANIEVKESTVYNKNNTEQSFSQDATEFWNLAVVLAFNENEWEFYDTHAGLYYLRPKKDIQDIGLKINTFTKIEHPCELKIDAKPTSWVDGFINLFDIATWNQKHSAGEKKIACISGHGTQRTCGVSRACGLPTEQFLKLMLFFNDTLSIDTLGVQSCYWPSARILELTAQHDRPQLHCQLITPIDREKTVYYAAEMPIIWTYEPDSQKVEIQESRPGELLLTGLHEIATSFNGTVTEELSEKLNMVQVVQINHKYDMKTSLIDAGASQPVFV